MFAGIVSVTSCSFVPPAPVPYFVDQVKGWSAAQHYCSLVYTDLAMVKDYNTLLKLREIVNNEGLTWWPIWIGLYYDTDSWHWSFESVSLMSTSLTLWSPGQPNIFQWGETCGGISGAGYWEDYNCTALRPFICYKGL